MEGPAKKIATARAVFVSPHHGASSVAKAASKTKTAPTSLALCAVPRGLGALGPICSCSARLMRAACASPALEMTTALAVAA